MSDFPTAYLRNKGYIEFVLAASSISACIYIYLIIAKCACHYKNRTVNFVLLTVAVMLQFSIGTTFAIAITNSYD